MTMSTKNSANCPTTTTTQSNWCPHVSLLTSLFIRGYFTVIRKKLHCSGSGDGNYNNGGALSFSEYLPLNQIHPSQTLHGGARTLYDLITENRSFDDTVIILYRELTKRKKEFGIGSPLFSLRKSIRSDYPTNLSRVSASRSISLIQNLSKRTLDKVNTLPDPVGLLSEIYFAKSSPSASCSSSGYSIVFNAQDNEFLDRLPQEFEMPSEEEEVISIPHALEKLNITFNHVNTTGPIPDGSQLFRSCEEHLFPNRSKSVTSVIEIDADIERFLEVIITGLVEKMFYIPRTIVHQPISPFLFLMDDKLRQFYSELFRLSKNCEFGLHNRSQKIYMSPEYRGDFHNNEPVSKTTTTTTTTSDNNNHHHHKNTTTTTPSATSNDSATAVDLLRRPSSSTPLKKRVFRLRGTDSEMALKRRKLSNDNPSSVPPPQQPASTGEAPPAPKKEQPMAYVVIPVERGKSLKIARDQDLTVVTLPPSKNDITVTTLLTGSAEAPVLVTDDVEGHKIATFSKNDAPAATTTTTTAAPPPSPVPPVRNETTTTPTPPPPPPPTVVTPSRRKRATPSTASSSSLGRKPVPIKPKTTTLPKNTPTRSTSRRKTTKKTERIPLAPSSISIPLSTMASISSNLVSQPFPLPTTSISSNLSSQQTSFTEEQYQNFIASLTKQSDHQSQFYPNNHNNNNNNNNGSTTHQDNVTYPSPPPALPVFDTSQVTEDNSPYGKIVSEIVDTYHFDPPFVAANSDITEEFWASLASEDGYFTGSLSQQNANSHTDGSLNINTNMGMDDPYSFMSSSIPTTSSMMIPQDHPY